MLTGSGGGCMIISDTETSRCRRGTEREGQSDVHIKRRFGKGSEIETVVFYKKRRMCCRPFRCPCFCVTEFYGAQREHTRGDPAERVPFLCAQSTEKIPFFSGRKSACAEKKAHALFCSRRHGTEKQRAAARTEVRRTENPEKRVRIPSARFPGNGNRNNMYA